MSLLKKKRNEKKVNPILELESSLPVGHGFGTKFGLSIETGPKTLTKGFLVENQTCKCNRNRYLEWIWIWV